MVVKHKPTEPVGLPVKLAKFHRKPKPKSKTPESSPRVQTARTLYDEKIEPMIRRINYARA